MPDPTTSERHLRAMLKRLAAQPCREFPKEKPGSKLGPPRFSCWTIRENARDEYDDLREDYRDEVLADDYPCDACIARYVLADDLERSEGIRAEAESAARWTITKATVATTATGRTPNDEDWQEQSLIEGPDCHRVEVVEALFPLTDSEQSESEVETDD